MNNLIRSLAANDGTDGGHSFGWVNDPVAVQQYLSTLARPLMAQAAPHLLAKGDGKTTLLYKAWKDVNGNWFLYPAQVIGCCVSRGWSEGIDLTQCVQIAVGKKREKFTPTSHEAVYALARVDIGGQRGSYQDGAVGAWAAKAVSTLGTIAQDLVGPYSDDKAKEWGARGLPADLKAKLGHKTGDPTLVTTARQAHDMTAGGYCIPVCSNQGFTMQRDEQGFCSPRGRWDHCMLICGARDDRPGLCIMQSWGMDTPSGPLALDQPPNSFWADDNVVDRMLAQQDSFAIPGFDGYPDLSLPSSWSYADQWA